MMIDRILFQRLCALLWVCQIGLGISAFMINPSSDRYENCGLRSRTPTIIASNYLSSQRKDSTTRIRPFTPTSIGGAVADLPAEKEGEETKHRSGDDDAEESASPLSSAWSRSKDGGGFIPNIPARFLPKRMVNAGQHELPKKKSLLPSRIPRVMQITDIHQYKKEVADVTDQIVVVRFYAPWCRACRAVESSYRNLQNEFPSVKFVEVPLTKSNAYLHEGLGVPSLPFAHIYDPHGGLVEERKVNKHVFPTFKKILRTYVKGECDVSYDEKGESNHNSGEDAAEAFE